MKDGWVWKVGGEENYVVKQVYQNLVSLWQPSLPREDTHFFRSLWKALAPSKTLGFTGKIMLDRVLTCNNLLRWNIRCDQNNYSCPLCSSCWETTHHVLFSCHVAYSLWMRVYEWFRILTVIPNEPSTRWCNHWGGLCGTKRRRRRWGVWVSVHGLVVVDVVEWCLITKGWWGSII